MSSNSVRDIRPVTNFWRHVKYMGAFAAKLFVSWLLIWLVVDKDILSALGFKKDGCVTPQSHHEVSCDKREILSRQLDSTTLTTTT